MNHPTANRAFRLMFPLVAAALLRPGACLAFGSGSSEVIRTPKVLVLGIDGLRTDALIRARTPVIDALIENGCLARYASTGDITISGPGWSSFLTGVWRDKHLVEKNTFEPRDLETYPHFFKRLREKSPGLTFAHFADWLPIDEFILADFDPDVRFAVDYEDDGDVKTVAAAVAMFESGMAPDCCFIYFADVDVAGHNHGFHPTVPEYRAEIEEVDAQIGQVLQALRSRAAYADENWLIILSTDHGGTIDGSHGRDEPDHRFIPFIVSGDGALRGELRDTVNQVDVPATAAAHLGVRIDPEWRWDGRPVGLKSLPGARLGVNLVFNGDAELSTGSESPETNAGVAGWTDWGKMTVLRYGAADGYPTTATSGASRGGRNFFVGANEPKSTIHQHIDLAPLAGEIAGGGILFELDADLGGYANQRDLAWIDCEFLDDRLHSLGSIQLTPVTLEDREAAFGSRAPAPLAGAEPTFDHLTGFVHRGYRGEVPAQARVVKITITTETAAGSNDGYVDNVSLVLSR